MAHLLCQTDELPMQFDGFQMHVNEQQARADIVLDNPPFNCVTRTQAEQLCAAFEALDDEPAVRVIVLRARGEHFSRGCETQPEGAGSRQHFARTARTLNAPARCSKPVIAANRGYCFGAGFELSLACDFRIATDTTLYALPARSEWQGFGPAGAERLLQMVGIGRARDVVMRSRYICGAQAYDWGIATDVVVDSELERFTDTLVHELLAFSALDQCAAKRYLNAVKPAAMQV